LISLQPLAAHGVQLRLAPLAAKAPLSQTPDYNTAVDFDAFTDSFGGSDDLAFQQDMSLQHYQITPFIGCGSVETPCTPVVAPGADGQLSDGKVIVESKSLFTGTSTRFGNNYVGAYLSDADHYLPPDTKIIQNLGNNQVALSAPPKIPSFGSVRNDRLTISWKATTANDFRTLLTKKFGVIFWSSHGLPSLVFVERHDSNARCQSALDSYQMAGNPGGAFSAGWLACPKIASQTFTANTENDSANVVVTSHLVAQFLVGRTVTGPGIQAGTTITAANEAENKLTLSRKAGPGSGDGVHLDVIAFSSDLAFTANGIKALFTDANSLVFGSSCYSQTLFENKTYTGTGYTGPGTGTGPNQEPDYVANAMAYGDSGFGSGNNGVPARDYFGFVHQVTVPNADADTILFFGRLAGLQVGPFGKGEARWAKVDFALGHWKTDRGIPTFHIPGIDPVFTPHGTTACAACDLDLSPSVVLAVPKKVTGKAEIRGWVSFDALMYSGGNPADLLYITSGANCAASLSGQKWTKAAGTTGYDRVDFTLTTTATAGQSVTIKIVPENAQATDGAALDGNQHPGNANGVAPNENAYIWTIPC
jgi:hypothetical protein